MQDLYKELIQLLEADQALIIDDKLNKGLIIDRALRLEPALIKLLLTNPSIKKQFFVDIEGILVFDKVAFQRFVNAKNFLPDSYTQYKNKIGLSTDNDHYITDSREVVLVWPHKDCVLEGGQTKEDAKRNEIFYNTTLAPNEIDVLTAPKALTNWKRYDKDGVTIPTKISKADNLIIKGNNLLALHTLKEKYRGQVKLIYIDPPYNTGNDSFGYNDNFNHSTWLTFMKNRLEVAKELLRNDGIICVHCDNNEQAYLKVLMDEIFISNFISDIAVKSSTPSGIKTAHKDKTIIKQRDSILVYAKNTSSIKINPQYILKENWDSHYTVWINKNNDGSYFFTKLIDEIKKRTQLEINSIKDLDINNKKFKNFYLENSDKIARFTSHKNKEIEKICTNEFKDKIYVKNENGKDILYFNKAMVQPLSYGIKEVYYNQSITNDVSMLLCDFWGDIDFQNTQNEGGVSFPNGKKPEILLYRLIKMFTEENEIVLDFHLGSGTTGAVSHKLNRIYIGIEQMNYEENDSVIRLQNVIKGETSGISKAVNWKGGGSFIYAELMQSNQNYITHIQEAKSSEELLKIWKEMQETAFISYKVLPENINKEIKEFEVLSIKEQQSFLVEILDKNLLYVNKSEINDARHKVSEADKEMNKNFYRYGI
jgi:adenine-specific DNA-methyltransferase